MASLSRIAGQLLLALWLATSASPTAPAQDIPPPKEGWSKPEQWVWERIKAGQVADFNSPDEELDPKAPDGWDERRKLSSGFLKEILFREPYRGAIPVEGVRIVGAWFPVPVDLAHGRLDWHLWLEKCRFEAAADLAGLHVDGWLSLEGSVFAAPEAASVAVNLISAEIRGSVGLGGATVAGELAMNDLTVGQHLFMGGGARFRDVDLTAAEVGGQLNLGGATVAGTLTMNGLAVERALLMRAGARFRDVDLTAAEVGGQLELDGATIAGTLKMNGLAVGRDLFMRAGATFQDVDLSIARVGGQLDLDGATVAGTLTMDGLAVGVQLILNGATVAGTLTMHGLAVEHSLLMREASYTGRVKLIFARIGANLDLSGSELTELDLTGTRITGELRLGSGVHPAPKWHDGARLNLRNAHAGALRDRPDAWEGLELQLDGFTYDHLGGFGDATAGGTRDDGVDSDMPTRDIGWYANGEDGWLDRNPSYSPQPYEQLAAVFRASGEPTKANWILYEGREREREEARQERLCLPLPDWPLWGLSLLLLEETRPERLCLPLPGWRWWGLSLLKWTMGYGLGLGYFRALWWVVAFTLLGSVLLLVSQQGPDRLSAKAFFSLDRLVPRLVQLDKSHDEVEAGLKSWVRRYFYLHKIVGYVLAGFLLAGLAGLTQG